MTTTILATISLALLASHVHGQSDIVGNVVVGYQGWFSAPGDGGPMNPPDSMWIHWVENAPQPYKDHQKFEIWPDTREYDQTFQTGYNNLGNGQPANLFSSWPDQVVDTHFKWMQQNNIDVAALQRFSGAPPSIFSVPDYRNLLNGVARKVRTSAEKYGRKFFIMWDNTFWDQFYTQILEDLDNYLIGELDIFSSPSYAYQNGKPVVAIWGFGFLDRPGDPAQCLQIINALKERGYYVIGGVPVHWRTGDGQKDGFLDVYTALDMVQPWSVRSFNGVDGAVEYGNWLRDDFRFLNDRGIDFQPVVFAGFSWSNWHPDPHNEVPRLHGDFMWQQFVNLAQIGIPARYVAMFDEYDEGTAIAKAAEDSSMIPTDQWFLTLDADGVHVSSDFYLRLVGDANRMLKGEIPFTPTHPTPHE